MIDELSDLKVVSVKGNGKKLMIESVNLNPILFLLNLVYKEIVEKLNLPVNTIKTHVHNILEKMSISTRTKIAKYANTANGYKELADSI
ncbi:MAG TPA: LuxR C-terminal-related transcriptional regulator [Ignavibacteria bacterium]